ncbi:MAG TPA: GDSL-type esterase/lipase family protein [Candidatus Limnocylindrales bacterium]|jgi:lysophospholipase L1-like esterase|nr:GDSL-type esterase/lipase family protein [Candidatus Limnocylindrales bacterium]
MGCGTQQTHSASATNKPAAAAERCAVLQENSTQKLTVFTGDSITDFWQQHENFSSHNWIDTGVPGVTSDFTLQHFQSDVIAARPKAVHIIIGTNDIMQQLPVAGTLDHIREMIALARNARITVVLGTIPPIDQVAPAGEAQVAELNAGIISLAEGAAVKVVDYHALLSGPNGDYIPRYTADGVHPSGDGYAVMTTAAEDALTFTCPDPVALR